MRPGTCALAHARGQPPERLLRRHALELLPHGPSLAPCRARLVLKGALLPTTWPDEPHRARRDLDLLGFGDRSGDALLSTFRGGMASAAADVDRPIVAPEVDAILGTLTKAPKAPFSVGQ